MTQTILHIRTYAFIDFAAKLAGLGVQYALKYSKYNRIAMCNMNEILKRNIKILLKISNAIWDKRVLKSVGICFVVL